jgi:formylmethanofuran--tetrahydromethanopterin N-formyltransferase
LLYKNIELEKATCECTDVHLCRVLLTALSERVALQEATYLSGFSVITSAPLQACVEGRVAPTETPDGRPGVLIQFNAPTKIGMEVFRKVLLDRLYILPHLPTCSLFDATPTGMRGEAVEIGEHLRRWGDSFEEETTLGKHEVIRLPIMTGDMMIERRCHVITGMDGVIEVLEASDRIFHDTRGVALFNYPLGGISGAKVGGINYCEEGVTINEPYCPTLRSEVSETKIPDKAEAVIEYPLIGLGIEEIKAGLRVAIDAFAATPGVMRITAPSFGGEWGKHQLYLPDVVSER